MAGNSRISAGCSGEAFGWQKRDFGRGEEGSSAGKKGLTAAAVRRLLAAADGDLRLELQWRSSAGCSGVTAVATGDLRLGNRGSSAEATVGAHGSSRVLRQDLQGGFGAVVSRGFTVAAERRLSAGRRSYREGVLQQQQWRFPAGNRAAGLGFLGWKQGSSKAATKGKISSKRGDQQGVSARV